MRRDGSVLGSALAATGLMIGFALLLVIIAVGSVWSDSTCTSAGPAPHRIPEGSYGTDHFSPLPLGESCHLELPNGSTVAYHAGPGWWLTWVVIALLVGAVLAVATGLLVSI